MKIAKITHYVSDQAAAKEFWIDKMGFVVKFEQQMGPNMTWLEVGEEDSFVSMVLYNKAMMEQQNPEVSTDTPSLMFSTNDIQTKYADMQAKGVKVDELQIMPYGSMFSFYDNDNNRFMMREDK